jgi:hypothetical protein
MPFNVKRAALATRLSLNISSNHSTGTLTTKSPPLQGRLREVERQATSPALRALKRALAQATEPALKASLARTIAALEARGRQ